MSANPTNLHWEINGHFLLNCNCDVFCNCPMSLGRAIPNSANGKCFSWWGIIIEDGCHIGVGSIILSGVTIGKGSIIGAGTIVRESVEPYSLVLGNPGKVVKKFD